MLWEREKYWQAQPFTLTHGLNSPNDGTLKTEEVIENKIFYHRIYSRLEFISCRNQLTHFFIPTIWRVSSRY